MDLDKYIQDVVVSFNRFADKIGMWYFVTGSCAMWLHGIDRIPKDIDIVVCDSTDMQRKMIAMWAKTQGLLEIRPARKGDSYFRMFLLNLDLFFHTSDEITEPGCIVWINGIPLASLERMLKGKEESEATSRNPEKHREDKRLILDFMKTKRAT